MTDSGIEPIYIDSNVFIYAVEGVPQTAEPARNLIRFLRRRTASMCTSEITLAEILAPSRTEGAWPLNKKRPVYLDLLVSSEMVVLLPVSRDILIRTAEVRDMRRLKLPDAIHLATALHHGCKFFVSGDSDFKYPPPEIEHVRSDQNGIDRLIQKLM
jgi:predicted nucleic acid-binding protein